MDALGTHLLLDLQDCDAELLDDLDHIREVVTRAAHEAGATVVGHIFHRFDPVGVTGIVAIAESHVSIHTWPEFSYAAADIFTCGNDLHPYRAAELIIEWLRCERPTVTEVARGQVASPTVAAV